MITQTPLKPRPVFRANRGECRDHAMAEAVCAGRFTHLDITLDLGVKPDWLTKDVPEDKEWRREWSKFGYGRQLAQAFADTDDPKFLNVWERLVRSWNGQVPVDYDDSFVIARRIQNWIHTWTLFTEAPGFREFSGGFTDELFASLRQQVAHLRGHLSPHRNHRTLELNALFLAALALPELDQTGDLVAFAESELHANLMADVLPDGVHREASTHYHHLALRAFLGAREAARRFGLDVSTEYDARLELACEFALHCHRPDGTIPALSDSDSESYLDLLELAASVFGRPDFLYVATSGASGVPPTRRYVSFPHGGYFVQRSGWGDGLASFKGERFLIFDCGPLGDGGHGHYDLLNVEIAAHGHPLVVDPGRYTYSEEPPNWRRWFKSTAAHNTVCVDGLDQTPYRRTLPQGPVATGRLVARSSAPGFDVVAGEATSPQYEVVHTRWVAFVADEYWIIVDRLRGSGSHHYDLRFHLAPEAWEQTTTIIGEATAVVRAPGVALVFAPARTPEIEPGWVAPRYGVKVPAPIVSVAASGFARADFFTLVVPLRSSEPPPSLRIHAAQGIDAARSVEVIRNGAHGRIRDLVTWNTSPQPVELGLLRGVAAAAHVRESAIGLQTVTACDVTNASCPRLGKSLLPRRRSPARWVRWDARRDVVEVSPKAP